MLLHVPQQLSSQAVVHRPSVVRIHEAEVPRLIALVDVRNARRRVAQQGLRERAEAAVVGDFAREWLQLLADGAAALQRTSDELLDGGVVLERGVDPGGI